MTLKSPAEAYNSLRAIEEDIHNSLFEPRHANPMSLEDSLRMPSKKDYSQVGGRLLEALVPNALVPDAPDTQPVTQTLSGCCQL